MKKNNSQFIVYLLGATLLMLSWSAQAQKYGREGRGHWVHTWTSMPQLTEPNNLPPEPYKSWADAENGIPASVFVDTTLRQTIHTSIGGKQMRVTFSNVFGTTPYTITAATVAIPSGNAGGASAIEPDTEKMLTFLGKPSITIPAGAQVVSDSLNYNIAPMSNLTITMYLADGQPANAVDTTSDFTAVPAVNVTSHPGSRTQSWMAFGNHISALDLGILPDVGNTFHWYFLSGIEVWADKNAAAVVIFGDSLADGRGSTNNGNDRWPNQLFARLQETPRTREIAVINQAAGGNAVLSGGLGPTGLSRLDRDAFSQSGVQWMIVCNGINDIGSAPATQEAQQAVADNLIWAYDQIIRRAHAQNIIVYGATLTPMKGHPYYDDTGYREAARRKVNQWIRTSGRFDAVLDFDAAIRDPDDPEKILDSMQAVFYHEDGTVNYVDALHLNPIGYEAMAEIVSPLLFWHRWNPEVMQRF